MIKSSKVSFFVILLVIGFSIIWLGFQGNSSVQVPVSSPIPSQVATSSAVITSIQGERGFVTKVVDGDTIIVNIDEQSFTVRLIGIDTPETVDPRRPVGCFGKQASNETKKILEGKNVILRKDVSDTDKYNRLLRYVYLPLDGTRLLFFNDYLVRKGFAKVYTYPPDVKFDIQLREAEQQARENKEGLWGAC